MKIGIMYSDGNRYSEFGNDRFKKIKEHGFDCIDYSLSNTNTGVYQMTAEEAFSFIASEKALLDDAKIFVSQVHGPWVIPKPDGTEEGRAKRFEECIRSIRCTARLGCNNWVIHPLFPFTGDDLDLDKAKETREMNIEFYSRLVPFAESEGVTICLENMPFPRFSLSKPAEILDIVNAVNHENFKICLDVGHVCALDMSPADAVRFLGDNIRAFHIHDTFPGGDKHMIPRFGAIDWNDFSKALKEIGFDGVFSMETLPPHSLSTELFEKTATLMSEIAKDIIK